MIVYAVIHDNGNGHEHVFAVCVSRKTALQEIERLYSQDCEWTRLYIAAFELL